MVDRAYENGTLSRPNYAHLQEDFEKIVASVGGVRATQSVGPAATGASVKVEREAVAVKETVTVGNMEQLGSMQSNMALRMNNEDAPMCTTCGSVMVRNGTCYKCIGCGDTSGCS